MDRFGTLTTCAGGPGSDRARSGSGALCARTNPWSSTLPNYCSQATFPQVNTYPAAAPESGVSSTKPPVVYSKRSKNPGLATGRITTPHLLVQTEVS